MVNSPERIAVVEHSSGSVSRIDYVSILVYKTVQKPIGAYNIPVYMSDCITYSLIAESSRDIQI